MTETLIELSKLYPSKTNPRKTYDKTRFAELAASIKEKGVITPLLVRPNGAGFEIIAGENRFKAAVAAKLEKVPVTVREMSDEEALELQIIENDVRADVHPLEQCAGYEALLKAGRTPAEVAKRVSKPVAYIHRRLRLAVLIEPIKKKFLAGDMSINRAFMIARLQPDQQKQTLPWLGDDWSDEHFQTQVERHFFLVLKEAPFDINDAELLPKAGACKDCPKRTGFNKLLFEDVKNEDTCTDPDCFSAKVEAFVKQAIAKAPKDILKLTQGDIYQKNKSKGIVDWVRAEGKKCDDTKLGIVIETLGHYVSNYQKAQLGQTIPVCTNAKCKTHHDFVTGYTRDKKELEKERARRIELRRRGLVFHELAQKPFKVVDDDYRRILDWAVKQLDHDRARALGQAMQWEPAKGQFGMKDWRATVEKNLAKLSTAEVERWMFLVVMASQQLWFSNNFAAPRPAQLEDKAKTVSVPLAELAKKAKEKQTKPKAEKKKGKAA